MSRALKQLLLFVVLSWNLTAAYPAAPKIAGTYVAAGRVKSSMVVGIRGDTVRIFLEGGSNPMDGPSVAGDCEAAAEGKLDGNVIRANLVPFEGDLYSLSASDIARLNSAVLVTFVGNRAVVEGTFSHCGLRSGLAGTYYRVRTKRPSLNK